MAEYQVVNATQLNEDLSNIADIIRLKKGTTEPITFPKEMGQAIYTIPGPKEEQEKKVVKIINDSTQFVVVPDSGKVMNKVEVDIKVETQMDENEILNQYGSLYPEPENLIYTKNSIGENKYCMSQFRKIYFPNPITISKDSFRYCNAELLWLGSQDLNSPSNETFYIKENCFSGSNNLLHLVINSSLNPIEAFSCEETSFSSCNKFEGSEFILYVPEDKLDSWYEVIYGDGISNFPYFPSDITSISNLTE